MNKVIRFERTEDVSVTYAYTMTEKEWPEFMEWFEETYPIGAKIIAGLSFDEVLAKMEDTDVEPITWEQPLDSGSGSYTEALEEIIQDYLREIAIDAGPVDESFYDDGGDERISIEDLSY